MKKIYLPIFMAATFLAAGCAKEEIVVPEEQNEVTVLTAGIQTKTVLQDDKAVLWTDGDKINVNGVESAALELDEASATAKFSLQGALETPYKAVYPASAYKDATTVTLPASQIYKAGTFEENTSAMVAYTTEGTNLVFHHLVNLVKLTLTAGTDEHQIKSVEFRGNAGEQVSGDFTVDFENATLASASTADADKVIVYSVNQNLTAEGLVMYIAVPAQEFSAGFTVKIEDEAGHVMEKSKSSAVNLAAGKIYELPAFAFAPTTTELDADIACAADLIAFAANYNAGKYSEDVVVTVTADFALTEEDNAAFVSIDGFTGTFDGNNKTISNFNSGKPLAAVTAAGSEIKNLTIAGTADVVLSDESPVSGTFAGRLGGTLTACVNKVSYSVSGTADVNVYFGAIAGVVEEGAVIDASQSQASVYFTAATTTYAYVGGIAGQSAGTITNTDVMEPEVKASHVDGETTNTASILLASTAAKYSWVAGLVGATTNTAQVSDCTNGADVMANIIRNSDANRYCHIAGLVAENAGTLKNSVNNAAVSHLSCEKTRWVAGLVGENKATAVIDNCENNGNLLVDKSSEGKGGRYNNIGGLIADNKSAAVSNVKNNGTVTLDMIENNANTTLLLGGCFGTTVGIADGGKIVNNASVTFNSAGWTATGGLHVGGVAATVTGDLNGVENIGTVMVTGSEGEGDKLFLGGVVGKVDSKSAVTILNSNNSGEVNFNVTGAKRAYSNICVGGIVGYNPSASLTVKECDNSGFIHTGLATSNNPSNKYIGGIVGFLEGNSVVDNCDMTGSLNNNDWNNATDIADGPAGGGIVGRALGKADGYITIKGCNVLSVNDSKLVARRGWLGGVVGYAKWTNVESCTVKQSSLVCSYYYYGGICGQMVAATAKDCVVEASTYSSQTKYAGGLVGRINGESSIENCTFKGDVNTDKTGPVGILAGQASSAGVQIKNCKYKGTLKGAASTVLVGANPENVTLTDNTELAE